MISILRWGFTSPSQQRLTYCGKAHGGKGENVRFRSPKEIADGRNNGSVGGRAQGLH